MMRTIQLGVLAVALSAATAGKTRAEQIFDFSFSNTIGNVPGTVTGQVVLPFDGNGTGAASEVLITSVPGALSIVGSIDDATNWQDQIYNGFTVFNGQITHLDPSFDALYYLNPPYSTPYVQLTLDTIGYNELLYNSPPHEPQIEVENQGGLSALHFERVSSTPEPTTITLLASGFFAAGGFGLYRRRRTDR